MRIAILSRAPDCYSTRHLVEASQKLGHEVEVIDYLNCYMNINSKSPAILYKGEPLHFDAIIPRIGASHTFYGCSVLRQFEAKGNYTINSSIAITRARDKLRSLQLLGRKQIGLPMTIFAHSGLKSAELIKMVGGPPVVIKLLEGTQGVGVVLAETKIAAHSIIEAFNGLKVHFLIQEYIKEAAGADIRCFVLGNKVVAAMKRQATGGDFRSNLHRGGLGTRVEITPEERTTAIHAAKVMGLSLAGVDLLRSERGPLVMEVNSSPGLQGIQSSTKKDVAKMIIKHLEKHTKPKKRVPKYEG